MRRRWQVKTGGSLTVLTAVLGGLSSAHQASATTVPPAVYSGSLGACLGNGPSGWFEAVHELGGLISHDLTLLRWRA
jgi:hypothetical protein